MNERNAITYVAMSTMVVAFIFLGYVVERENFGILFLCYATAFIGSLILTYRGSVRLTRLIYFAILCRSIFLFSIPSLSDDYFRFLWDGHLINHGFSPFLALPSELINNTEFASNNIMKFLYQNMNSQHYYSVYPTIMQAIFGAGTYLFPDSILNPIMFYHSIILLSEVFTLYFLRKTLLRFKLPENNILLYALNPLVIVELMGNLHFEAVMICFLSAGIYFLVYQKKWIASIFLSLSVAVKLTSMLAFPALLKKFSIRENLFMFALSGMILVGLFSPLLSQDFFKHFVTSIGLYFHSFEFNGSVYKVFRWLGFIITGHNLIFIWAVAGPLLFLFLYRKIYQTTERDDGSTILAALMVLTLYYFLASAVHPWYLSTLIFLNVFFRFRYMLLWSLLIPLSYFTYRQIPYQENILLSWLEYLPVIMLFLAEFKYRFFKPANM